jgi:hypothetical protein
LLIFFTNCDPPDHAQDRFPATCETSDFVV